MSELKAVHAFDVYEAYTKTGDDDAAQVYLKSEADKVIANRDSEIKKLKDSIGKLLKAKTEQVMDEVFQKCLIYGEGFVPVEHAMKLVAATRQSNYKRCLALSQEWRSYATFCGMQSSYHNNRGFGKTAAKYTWKEIHAWKCVKRWLELYEKFKTNSTINRKEATNAL